MTFMKNILIFILLTCIPGLYGFAQTMELRQEVAFLADSIGNRYPASNGDLRARAHLMRQFAAFGMESFEQTFNIVESMWGEGSLSLTADSVSTSFSFGKDFVIQARSATDTLSAGYVVIFNGFPDSRPRLIQGKVVICPYKCVKGRTPTIAEMEQAGAAALIYVNPPQKNVKQTFSKGGRIHSTHKIPVLTLDNNELKMFIPDGAADTLSQGFYAAPPSHKIHIATKHHENHLQAANVIGIKKGYSNKYIIIGAHYDTVAPDNGNGEPVRGANDNASGVAMMLALAKRLNSIKTHHNIIFVAFSGEEKGCLGSKEFVARMPFRKECVKEMINLDMVGCLKQNLFYYKQFNSPMITPSDVPSRTALQLTESEDALSDHYDFVKEGIPSTVFHTGPDDAIHTADDIAGRLNYEGMSEILEFLTNYIITLSTTTCRTTDMAIQTQ